MQARLSVNDDLVYCLTHSQDDSRSQPVHTKLAPILPFRCFLAAEADSPLPPSSIHNLCPNSLAISPATAAARRAVVTTFHHGYVSSPEDQLRVHSVCDYMDNKETSLHSPSARSLGRPPLSQPLSAWSLGRLPMSPSTGKQCTVHVCTVVAENLQASNTMGEIPIFHADLVYCSGVCHMGNFCRHSHKKRPPSAPMLPSQAVSSTRKPVLLEKMDVFGKAETS